MASRNKRRRASQAATPQEPPTAPSKHAKRSPTWQASQDAAKAARRARAEEARAELAAQVKDLVAVGADFERAARATNKTVGALEKALYRAKRPDLIEKLKQRAA
jgi:hypothetical protein